MGNANQEVTTQTKRERGCEHDVTGDKKPAGGAQAEGDARIRPAGAARLVAPSRCLAPLSLPPRSYSPSLSVALALALPDLPSPLLLLCRAQYRSCGSRAPLSLSRY
jgi:hypothetical protein